MPESTGNLWISIKSADFSGSSQRSCTGLGAKWGYAPKRRIISVSLIQWIQTWKSTKTCTHEIWACHKVRSFKRKTSEAKKMKVTLLGKVFCTKCVHFTENAHIFPHFQ